MRPKTARSEERTRENRVEKCGQNCFPAFNRFPKPEESSALTLFRPVYFVECDSERALLSLSLLNRLEPDALRLKAVLQFIGRQTAGFEPLIDRKGVEHKRLASATADGHDRTNDRAGNRRDFRRFVAHRRSAFPRPA